MSWIKQAGDRERLANFFLPLLLNPKIKKPNRLLPAADKG
jgi:hypothetical protein